MYKIQVKSHLIFPLIVSLPEWGLCFARLRTDRIPFAIESALDWASAAGHHFSSISLSAVIWTNPWRNTAYFRAMKNGAKSHFSFLPSAPTPPLLPVEYQGVVVDIYTASLWLLPKQTWHFLKLDAALKYSKIQWRHAQISHKNICTLLANLFCGSSSKGGDQDSL